MPKPNDEDEGGMTLNAILIFFILPILAGWWFTVGAKMSSYNACKKEYLATHTEKTQKETRNTVIYDGDPKREVGKGKLINVETTFTYPTPEKAFAECSKGNKVYSPNDVEWQNVEF